MNGIPVAVQYTDKHRVLTRDNFTAHHSHIVAQAYDIQNGNSNFTDTVWPPHQPKFSPIEYHTSFVRSLHASTKINAESTVYKLIMQ